MYIQESKSPEPWGDYHAVVAMMILIGVLWGIHSVDQLVNFLRHLNALEESGLAVCFLVVITRALRLIRLAVTAIAAAFGR